MTDKIAIILSILTFNIALSDSMNFVGDMMFGRRYYCTGANSYDDDNQDLEDNLCCLLYTSPSPRDATLSRMPSSA